ncbi:MAG TPA: TIGR01777 family oxidoreductase [Isosphaeraceae bacterium]|nr:TIGR01777 family oxidoreductase [Isosphaeraceae bacterium]
MRVFVTGGTGLIGRALIRKLLGRGDGVVVLSRSPEKARGLPALKGAEVVAGDPGKEGDWRRAVDGCDAVVNLVGHNIFDGRWTAEVKRTIRDSRVYATEHVVAAMNQAERRPGVLVNASAIGYYGPHGDEELTEGSPSGSDFMAVVCREWEDATHPAAEHGARVALVRTGVVLARGEGALGVMTPIFKYLPGGAAPVGGGGNPLAPGSGKQWMSWIHLDDIAGIFLTAIDHPDARGPINGTSPNPVRNAEFARVLARTLRKWGWTGLWPPFVPVGPPDVLLRLVLGEVAQVVTEGQRVLPSKAQSLNYSFRFPDLESALADLFGRLAPAPEPVATGAGH